MCRCWLDQYQMNFEKDDLSKWIRQFHLELRACEWQDLCFLFITNRICVRLAGERITAKALTHCFGVITAYLTTPSRLWLFIQVGSLLWSLVYRVDAHFYCNLLQKMSTSRIWNTSPDQKRTHRISRSVYIHYLESKSLMFKNTNARFLQLTRPLRLVDISRVFFDIEYTSFWRCNVYGHIDKSLVYNHT